MRRRKKVKKWELHGKEEWYKSGGVVRRGRKSVREEEGECFKQEVVKDNEDEVVWKRSGRRGKVE